MLRFFGKLLAALLALPLLYLLAALMLGNIVREPPRAAATRDITVYLLDNGVHTDLAVPLNTAVFDWTPVIDPAMRASCTSHLTIAFHRKFQTRRVAEDSTRLYGEATQHRMRLSGEGYTSPSAGATALFIWKPRSGAI